MNKKNSGISLIPFLLFVVLYLGSGVVLDILDYEMSFYVIPSPVFIFIAIIFAFIIIKGTVDEKFNTFVRGCGNDDIIIMCLIYLLAGAFSTMTKATGAVDSVVNLSLKVFPVQFITVGIFLVSFFLSTATGTSVGTVVALGDIAVGVADKGGLSTALVLGALVGGAMAGDNLSLISDTTIAATRTQGVEMKDKFKMNFKITLPAVVVVSILLIIFGRSSGAMDTSDLNYSLINIIPYILVLVTALIGINVFVVLTLGIILAAAIGLMGGMELIEVLQNIYAGFTSVTEIFLLSMLTGGLANMVREDGGIDWLIGKIKYFIKGEKSSEIAVAGFVSVADAALANNTVSIIIVGPVAKELSEKFHVDPRRMASLLDIFSCCIQGIIPYGAQLLIAAGFTEGGVSPVEIVPYSWYSYVLMGFAILSVFVRYSDAKDKWDFSEAKE